MKLVLVEWKDPTCWATHGWEDREPWIEKPLSCISVGILLHEDKDNIHVVLNLTEGKQCEGEVLPRGCIKRIRPLKVK